MSVLPRITGPIGWRFHPGFGLLGIAMLATGVVQPHLSAGVMFAGGLMLLALWCVMGAIWLISAGANVRRTGDQRGSWFRWMIAPPVVLLLATSRSGVNLNFWIARPALDRLAAAVAATPPDAPLPPNQMVWLMKVRDIQRLGNGGMRFATYTASNPFDYTGLAYNPTPVPEGTEHEGCYFHEFCGPWQTFWKP